jgi:hypothetical protein
MKILKKKTCKKINKFLKIKKKKGFPHIYFFLFILYLLQSIEIKLNWNYPLSQSSIIDDFFFNLK